MQVMVNNDKLKLDENYYKKFGLSVFKKTSDPNELAEYHTWGGRGSNQGEFQLVLIKE